MPINCPINIEGSCKGCRNFTDDSCWWHTPHMPIVELLTIDEKLELIDAKLTELEAPHQIIKYEKPILKKDTRNRLVTKDVL